MRRLFISYARENKPDVDSLVSDLESLGYETWLDSSLRGGQKWWEEILQRIADSDLFVTVVSPQSLNSVACRRELEWASALNKQLLPLALGPLPDALPRALSSRQITPYSASSREAAFALAGALGNLPPAQPLPSPLPEAPLAPLSYLTDLVDHVNQAGPLTHDQQREILLRLEPALDSADPEEARGARYILETFSKRDDLYAGISKNLQKLGITEPPQAIEDLQPKDASRTINPNLQDLSTRPEPGIPEGNSDNPDAAARQSGGKIQFRTYHAPGLDCGKLVKQLESWLESEQMANTDYQVKTGYVIECVPMKKLTRITGSGSRTRITLKQEGDELSVEVSDAGWKDKAISFGSAVALGTVTGGWGLLLTAPSIVGAYRQSTLPGKIFDYVSRVIGLCQ